MNNILSQLQVSGPSAYILYRSLCVTRHTLVSQYLPGGFLDWNTLYDVLLNYIYILWHMLGDTCRVTQLYPWISGNQWLVHIVEFVNVSVRAKISRQQLTNTDTVGHSETTGGSNYVITDTYRHVLFLYLSLSIQLHSLGRQYCRWVLPRSERRSCARSPPSLCFAKKLCYQCHRIGARTPDGHPRYRTLALIIQTNNYSSTCYSNSV